MSLRPFHLAIPVDDLEKVDRFYSDVIGCGRGRQSEDWIDFDFYGHQLVAHLKPEECNVVSTSTVDGAQVPVRHFGVVLKREQWEALRDRIQAAGVNFILEPQIRFKGKPGEQGTMFVLDPSANALEFKYYEDDTMLFATE